MQREIRANVVDQLRDRVGYPVVWSPVGVPMTDLRTLVHTALDNALENGYDGDLPATLDVLRSDPNMIAIDLLDCDPTISTLQPNITELVIHIQEWQDNARKPKAAND